jgi:hypothetical protein
MNNNNLKKRNRRNQSLLESVALLFLYRLLFSSFVEIQNKKLCKSQSTESHSVSFLLISVNYLLFVGYSWLLTRHSTLSTIIHLFDVLVLIAIYSSTFESKLKFASSCVTETKEKRAREKKIQ